MTSPTGLLSHVNSIDRIQFFGAPLSENLREALVSASFDMSTDQVSQLTLQFCDPGWKHMKDGVIIPGAWADVEDFQLMVANLEVGEVGGSEGWTAKCRSRAVRFLKGATGAKVMSKVSPTQYIQAECAPFGIKVVAQASAQRSQVARDVPEPGQTYDTPPSAWTTFQRLADELGYICYEAANTVYFGQPTWLLNNADSGTFEVGYKTGDESLQCLTVPTCSKSEDAVMKTVTLELPLNRISTIRPGKKLHLSGVPYFEGDYMVSSIQLDLAKPDATLSVTAQTPIDPQPHPPESRTGTGSGSSAFSGATGRTGTRSAEDFVYWAMKQIGDRYVFGAAVDVNNPNPTQFDCSALVQWALGRVGIRDCPRTSEPQIAWAQRLGQSITVASAAGVRGALLWHQGHVAISLGNGKTVEAANVKVGVISGSNITGRFTRAALIPHLAYGALDLRADKGQSRGGGT